MGEKTKPQYSVDFLTSLPVDQCSERLEREAAYPAKGLGGLLAPITQRTLVLDNGNFVIERTFPGAIHPIRLVGHLDAQPDRSGTHVHGAITHEPYNQVLIEGLLAFVGFFLFSVLFFLRLKVDGLALAVVLFLLALGILQTRWRVLRAATEDIPIWVRRRLYVTPEQARRQP